MRAQIGGSFPIDLTIVKETRFDLLDAHKFPWD